MGMGGLNEDVTCMYVYICICTHIHTYIHMYIHTYIHTYVYVHTYVYTYIHTYYIVCVCVCVCVRARIFCLVSKVAPAEDGALARRQHHIGDEFLGVRCGVLSLVHPALQRLVPLCVCVCVIIYIYIYIFIFFSIFLQFFLMMYQAKKSIWKNVYYFNGFIRRQNNTRLFIILRAKGFI